MALISLQRHKLVPTIARAYRFYCSRVISIEVNNLDVIDNYTSQLLKNKLNKWSTLNLKKCRIKESSYNLEKPNNIDLNLSKLSDKEFDTLCTNIIDESNDSYIKYFITKCFDYEMCPSSAQITSIFDIYSRIGDVDMVNNIKLLVKTYKPESYRCNGEFDYYLAEAMWMKGDIIKALELFDLTYRKNAYLRRRIRLMLRYLILGVTTRSEAVLVNIIKFSEDIKNDFGDFFVLACVWQACFLSEWFADQILALELLEKHDGLCQAVVANISYVVNISLRAHQTEIVYRLLEILLKYDLKSQYSIVLVALFDYRFRQRDLRSCREIIQWSVTHNTALPNIVHKKFLTLLLKRNLHDNTTLVGQKKKPSPPDYMF